MSTGLPRAHRLFTARRNLYRNRSSDATQTDIHDKLFYFKSGCNLVYTYTCAYTETPVFHWRQILGDSRR